MTDQEITPSRFTMWRAVVAMVHADGIVTPHELSFINENIKGQGFTAEQLGVIAEDLQVPQDTYEMYNQIEYQEDKRDFFALARALSWSDGDFDNQEAAILRNLEKLQANEETMSLLNQSREVVKEVELSQGQWTPAKAWNMDLFGFLSSKAAHA